VRPDSSLADFADWCRRHARCFADIDPWMEELVRHDVVVGARYHGTALGLQAGVPALCLTIDVRTAELCASSGLPCLPVEQLGSVDRASLRRHIRERFDPRAFTANRAAMAERFMALLRAHGLTPSPHLEPLRLAAALPEPEPALSR
jgi:polysaccharide pyruvyl transferase WcaK-like protein